MLFCVVRTEHKFDLRFVINEKTSKWRPVIMHWQRLTFLTDQHVFSRPPSRVLRDCTHPRCAGQLHSLDQERAPALSAVTILFVLPPCSFTQRKTTYLNFRLPDKNATYLLCFSSLNPAFPPFHQFLTRYRLIVPRNPNIFRFLESIIRNNWNRNGCFQAVLLVFNGRDRQSYVASSHDILKKQ